MAFKRSAVRSRLSPPEGNRGKALGHNGPGLFPVLFGLGWGVAKRCYIACLALYFLRDFGYMATGLAPWLLDVLGLELILWLLMMATEKGIIW